MTLNGRLKQAEAGVKSACEHYVRAVLSRASDAELSLLLLAESWGDDEASHRCAEMVGDGYELSFADLDECRRYARDHADAVWNDLKIRAFGERPNEQN